MSIASRPISLGSTSGAPVARGLKLSQQPSALPQTMCILWPVSHVALARVMPDATGAVAAEMRCTIDIVDDAAALVAMELSAVAADGRRLFTRAVLEGVPGLVSLERSDDGCTLVHVDAGDGLIATIRLRDDVDAPADQMKLLYVWTSVIGGIGLPFGGGGVCGVPRVSRASAGNNLVD